MKKLLIPALALLFAVPSVQADTHSVDLSLWSPSIQLQSPADDVGAFRLAVYGVDNNVTGLDLGIWTVATGEFNGLQYSWAYGRTENDFNGVQLGIVSRVRGEMYGVDFGIVNFVDGKACGYMDGFYNQVGGEMKGLQAGFVNSAAVLNGVQFGFVNFADTGYGLQIGLVNFFGDGFLPVFPLFNFHF